MVARLAGLSVLLTVLAACQTPATLKQSSMAQHEAIAAFAPPVKTAACLQRGYEDAGALFVTRLTPLGDDSYELVVREDTMTWVVLEIRPGTVEYWVDERFHTEPKAMLRGLLARCR